MGDWPLEPTSWGSVTLANPHTMHRLMILAIFAMGLLTWILLRSRDLTKRLLAWTSRFRRQRKFLYYRLLDGLQEFV